MTHIANDRAEPFHIFGLNCYLGSDEIFANVNWGKDLVVAISELPVECLDAFVAVIRDFVNRSEALRRLILKLERKGNRATLAFFEQDDGNRLRPCVIGDFDCLEILNAVAIGSSGAIDSERDRD